MMTVTVQTNEGLHEKWIFNQSCKLEEILYSDWLALGNVTLFRGPSVLGIVQPTSTRYQRNSFILKLILKLNLDI